MRFHKQPFHFPVARDATIEADDLLDTSGLFVALVAAGETSWPIALDTLDATAPIEPADRLDVVRHYLPTPAGIACAALAERVREGQVPS